MQQPAVTEPLLRLKLGTPDVQVLAVNALSLSHFGFLYPERTLQRFTAPAAAAAAGSDSDSTGGEPYDAEDGDDDTVVVVVAAAAAAAAAAAESSDDEDFAFGTPPATAYGMDDHKGRPAECVVKTQLRSALR
jgi:hypothetical protein